MTEREPHEADRADAAKELFLEYVLDREDGKDVDFEALCRAHPELEADLKRFEADHRWLASYFDGEQTGVEEGERFADVTPSSRYSYLGELARGGMGSILRVWDAGLRRELAMKVALPPMDSPSSSSTKETKPLRPQPDSIIPATATRAKLCQRIHPANDASRDRLRLSPKIAQVPG